MSARLSNLNPTWNLDAIFPGGVGGTAFTEALTALETDIADYRKAVDAAAVPTTEAEAVAWGDLIDRFQALARRLRQAGAFARCTLSAHAQDQQARIATGKTQTLGAAFGAAADLLDSQLLRMADPVFASLLAQERFAEIRYPLTERRQRAKEMLPPATEAILGDLEVDGYHGWNDMYGALVTAIKIPFETDGKQVELSVGQTANRMASGDPAVRAEAAVKWEAAWSERADLFATVLNHLGGYRLSLYKHRGWESILREPLENNRMQAATLDAMWQAVVEAKPHLVRFLERKARLMGKERLNWEDVSAPLATASRTVPYDEAANFIVAQFGAFSPRLGQFAERAFAERWIEVEDRPGKRPGGFCAGMPLAKESRIFMTYSGTLGNLSTLAHELGHAYHGHLLFDLPQQATNYAMNVAETASTFAENIVADAAVRLAATEAERLALLQDRIETAVSYYMNIHARFLFETRFYAERRQGMLSVARLNQLMQEAQAESFCGALGSYHPTFWASKLHFYATGQPFYNFPYTFGYLFSAGIYARAKAEGPAFEARYDDLLRDTGRMRVEELAQKHLGVDLTQVEFWRSATRLVIDDVAEYLRVTG